MVVMSRTTTLLGADWKVISPLPWVTVTGKAGAPEEAPCEADVESAAPEAVSGPPVAELSDVLSEEQAVRIPAVPTAPSERRERRVIIRLLRA